MIYLRLLVLLCLSGFTALLASSCRPYLPYFKAYSNAYINKEFPYELFAGQDYQESRCRFVISYDGVGSESPAQITWRLWRGFLKPYGIYNLRTVSNFTKAQTLIMAKLIRKSRAKDYKPLWIPFQAYNGGWLVLKEIKRAGGITYQPYVKRFCKRRTIHFRNGTSKSACDINYEYPHLIDKWTKKFYRKEDYPKEWNLWGY